MKKFFILGRNPSLSRIELRSYIESRLGKYEELFFDCNLLVIDINIEVKIQELGGTLFAGDIIYEGDVNGFNNFLRLNEIVELDKFSYAVFGNFGIDELKEKFKEERKKAVLKQGHKKISFQEGGFDFLPSVENIFFVYKHKKKVYFGVVSDFYNYYGLEKRDMKKPYRRESLSISPRLSKILINLSGARKGDLLLDPFCGVGCILIEAMALGINVFGIDKSPSVLDMARKNIDWAIKEFGFESSFELLNTDSRNAPNRQFDCVACEPSLGKLLRSKASDEEAKEIIFDFEESILPILKRLKEIKKRDARIAITFPKIKSFRVNYKEICKKAGLEVIFGPICESRKEQYVERDIFVFK